MHVHFSDAVFKRLGPLGRIIRLDMILLMRGTSKWYP